MRTSWKPKTLTIIQEKLLCLSNQLNLVLVLSLSYSFTEINLPELNLHKTGSVFQHVNYWGEPERERDIYFGMRRKIQLYSLPNSFL